MPGCHFDTGHSGAYLAWRRFHPDEPVPELILYVEDRDLWKWEMPDSREVSAAIDSRPYDFAAWDRLDTGALALEGAAILRYQKIQVGRIAAGAHMVRIAGHRVPAACSPVLASEVCEELLRRFPDAPFSAVYRCQDAGSGRTERKWSLRGPGQKVQDQGINLAQLAEAFGGGGHPRAAGFSQPAPRDAVPQSVEPPDPVPNRAQDAGAPEK